MGSSKQSVLVVGGGPAGATTAALIAREGFAVTLVEQAAAPRYHIGESLLPSCLRIFDLLGVRDKIEAHGFQRKDGAYFDWGPQKWEVAFGGPAVSLYGFQVVRSEFDKLLLDHARSQGVNVLEQTEVVSLIFDGDRPKAANVLVQGTASRMDFDILVDASGRAGLLATRYLKNRRFHEAFQNYAIWGYWRNAKPLPVGPFGAIATCSISSGWIWAIPLHDGSLSVGVVLQKSRLKSLREHFTQDEIYRDAIASNGTVSDLIDGAELITPLRVETDYSYAAERFAGPGYFLVGDAACFLDPLLSTGVHLAMFSGLAAAASIASILRGEIGQAEAAGFFNASYRHAYLRMLVVVGAFYQTHRGRDSHFKDAQKLTQNDYSETEIGNAFLHIISGTEDLRDLQNAKQAALLDSLITLYEKHFGFVSDRDAWADMPLETINEARTRIQFVNAVQEDFSLTAATSINGLFLSAEPKALGLRRVTRAPAARA